MEIFEVLADFEVKLEFLVCRICLNDATDLISVFQIDEAIQKSFSELITQLAESEVISGDGLPETICLTCSAKFVDAYNLRQQTQTSSRILRNNLVNASVGEDKNPLLEDDLNVEPPKPVIDDIQTTAKRKSNKVTTSTERFVCQFCGLSKFQSNSRLLRHIKIAHSDHEFVCDKCPKRFKHEGNYYRHRKLVHQKYRFSCDKCPQQFHAVYNLRMHVLERHTEGELKFSCNICSRKFKQEAVLEFHKKRHRYGQVSRGDTAGKYIRHKCVTCDQQYDSREEYEAHQKTVHPEGNKCQDCGKVCQSDVKLKQHRLNLHAKLWKCTQCEYETYNAANFTRHKKTHDGIREFSCSFCNKKFSQKISVKVHERTHTGEKPHKCEICNISFSDPSTLYKHKKRQHTQ